MRAHAEGARALGRHLVGSVGSGSGRVVSDDLDGSLRTSPALGRTKEPKDKAGGFDLFDISGSADGEGRGGNTKGSGIGRTRDKEGEKQP